MMKTKKTRRRISVLYGTPSLVVTNPIAGRVELRAEGSKLGMTIVLDEYNMRALAAGIRAAFGMIKRTRVQRNDSNYESLEEQ